MSFPGPCGWLHMLALPRRYNQFALEYDLPNAIRTMRIVLRLARSGWVPEVRPVWLVYTCSGTYLRKMFSPEQQGFPGHRVRPQSGRDTYDISATEFFLSNIEHFCQVVPVNNICLHEDSSRITCVRVDELLCFGSKTKVGDYYVAFVLEQQFGKGEIDASRRSAAAFKCSQ
jgi:hypothetical protein